MASTIKDVAKLAGVSPSTVSGVLNKCLIVRPETLKKITDAIEQTNYRPNAIARGLRKRETKMLGLLLPTITNPYYPLIARGAEEEANENGYHVFLCNTERDKLRQSCYINSAVDKSMDGLIFCNLSISKEEIELLSSEKIAVCASQPVDSPFIDVVEVDHFSSARDVTNYLISIGHRRIALINGSGSHRSDERYRGFAAAFIDNGLRHDESLTICGDFSPESTYRCTNELLDKKEPPTCILSTGNMAVFTINAALDRGLRVPEDLSVACSDNALSMFFPSMMSVDYHGFEFGRQLVKMVISRRMAYDTLEKRRIVLPYEILYGKSVRPIQD